MRSTPEQEFCPYGTYQRATAGWRVRELTPRRVIRLMQGRLKKSARYDRRMKAARHGMYRAAVRRWLDDLHLMNDFRL